MTPAHTIVDFASWSVPGVSFTITYSVGVLHEIDFLVNEGYRSIPYGGIEIGGLLFGRLDRTEARIEAFRTIPCEHASGPSFVLSERDLAVLRNQLEAASADPELEGLERIGWFISHTRKSLEMNDRESALFEQLFPGPGKITLLIKPERFKPTRFGFLVRGADGRVERDATQHAIILPLSGRAAREATAPVPSISAPVAAPAPEPVVEPVSEPVVETVPATAATSLATLPQKSALPPIDEIGRRRSENLQAPEPFDARSTHQQITRRMREGGNRSNARLVAVLFLAAALGCAVGYWGYLQLPSAIIPLTIRSRPPTLLVSWPPQQTRDAVYATIRIDDGEPLPLSPADKAAGEAEITATTGNVKVELVAQHWMRDSRGIARYVRALKPAQPAPPAGEEPPRPNFHRHRRR